MSIYFYPNARRPAGDYIQPCGLPVLLLERAVGVEHVVRRDHLGGLGPNGVGLDADGLAVAAVRVRGVGDRVRSVRCCLHLHGGRGSGDSPDDDIGAPHRKNSTNHHATKTKGALSSVEMMKRRAEHTGR